MAQGNYAGMSEVLAASIRQTQLSIKNISVVTDQAVDASLFDQVIPVPIIDMAKDSNWKIENRSQFYELTPYSETVILDADMVFLSDVSHWWNTLSKFEICITDKVKTYRNEWADNSIRAVFKNNQLPNTYSAFTYFKKTSTVKKMFDLIKLIIKDWDEWTLRYCPENRQPKPSIDVALAIAVKILDLSDEVFCPLEFPTFTHMKSECQGWDYYSDKWTNHTPCNYQEGILRLGPYRQSGILHYVDKELEEFFRAVLLL